MILVDSNILMYAAGAAHPHKAKCIQFLEQVALAEVDAAVDSEALQEVLHRYQSLKRWAEGRLVYDSARRIFPQVLPITAAILDHARKLMDTDAELTARDAVHASVVFVEGLEAICSFDRDYDRIAGLKRIEP